MHKLYCFHQLPLKPFAPAPKLRRRADAERAQEQEYKEHQPIDGAGFSNFLAEEINQNRIKSKP